MVKTAWRVSPRYYNRTLSSYNISFDCKSNSCTRTYTRSSACFQTNCETSRSKTCLSHIKPLKKELGPISQGSRWRWRWR